MIEGITGAVSQLSSHHGQAAKNNPSHVRGAAQQFEALLIGQMLKTMHDSEGGWLGSGDDQSSSAMEYAQEMFAQSLASAGGMGVAQIVVGGLAEPPKS